MNDPVNPYSWPVRVLLFVIVGGSGGFIVLAYAGVVWWPPSHYCTARFCDPHHWQVLSFGLAFLCAGLAFLIPGHWRTLGRLNSVCLIIALLAALIGSFAVR
jgi:hypothetical protein